MKRAFSSILLFATAIHGCTCDDNLTEEPDSGVELPDAAVVEVPDAAVACTPSGVVTGKVCAPGAREFVAGADVTLSILDCTGAPSLLTTSTDSTGTFRLENVPAGTWRMEARSGGFVQPYSVTVEDGQTTTIAEDQLCIQQDVQVAVITGDGDRIEDLLTRLGINFTTYDGRDGFDSSAGPFLANAAELATYDIIFINCAAATTSYTVNLGNQSSQLTQNLREYVLAGGSLYASDWAVVFPAISFPEHVRPRISGGGGVNSPFDTKRLEGYAPQTVQAEVVDTFLQAALQKDHVSISFPNETGARSTYWGLLQDLNEDARVLVRGTVTTCQVGAQYCDDRDGPGPSVQAPLALGFKLTPITQRGGNVYYTSFHNIAQEGDDVVNILKYIIFHL